MSSLGHNHRTVANVITVIGDITCTKHSLISIKVAYFFILREKEILLCKYLNTYFIFMYHESIKLNIHPHHREQSIIHLEIELRMLYI